MTKTAAELEQEVEAVRGRIDSTVEALKGRMQPGELFDEATRMMNGASNKVLTTAVDQLKANPLPIALIGAGIAWLALSQRSHGGAPASGFYPTYEGYDEDEGVRARMGARLASAKEKVSETADKAREKLHEVEARAGDGISQARGKASELSRTAQDKAVEYAGMARQRFDDTLQNEPLVIGAIGLAVGAAIGAALPSTPVERRYIGPARAKAAEAAKTSFGEVKDVAERAYGQVKDELRRQTGPAGDGASLREKAGAVVGAGAQIVKDEIEGRAH